MARRTLRLPLVYPPPTPTNTGTSATLMTACEIDADYYAAAVERVQRETRQLSLFTDNALALARAGEENSNEATDTQDENKH